MTTESVGGRRTYTFGVGDRLRVAREIAGFSQDELARITGISRQTISNYELGVTKPKEPYLAAIALATGFDKNWIRHGAVTTVPSPDGGGIPDTRGYRRLLRGEYLRLPPRQDYGSTKVSRQIPALRCMQAGPPLTLAA